MNKTVRVRFAAAALVAASCTTASSSFVENTEHDAGDGGGLDSENRDAGVDGAENDAVGAEADGGAAGSDGSCASAASSSCYFNCAVDEVCYTQVSCGPGPGGPLCNTGSGAPYLGIAGDGRCHRICQDAGDCAEGESCTFREFVGCNDSPSPARGLCCRDGGCN